MHESYTSARLRLRSALLVCGGLILGESEARGQGCMPAGFMSPSLAAKGLSVLKGGQWEASLHYRYLESADPYIGDDVWEEGKEIAAKNWIHSLDVEATYAFTPRYTLTLTIPFVSGERSTVLDHDGNRHTTRAGGLADVRLVGRAWLLNPEEERSGNVLFGLGVKAPTGDDEATDTFYKPTGAEIRHVDQAIQPGDGGWGIILEAAGYQKIIDRLFGYASGFYLINPREENNTLTTGPYPPGPNGAVRKLSVPDQYSARAGVAYTIWPEQGVSLSLGGRIDGVPPRDLIGGSEGFRRPGYSAAIEPGVGWENEKNRFSLLTPVMVYANRQKNIYDDRYGTHGPAAFADFLIIASYSRRF